MHDAHGEQARAGPTLGLRFPSVRVLYSEVEASYLRLPYTLDRENTEGRVVIEAAWKPYSSRELWELERAEERAIDEAEEYRT